MWPPTRQSRMGLACVLVALTGCTHTYVYGDRAPPTFERGKLVVPSSDGAERYSVRRVGVASNDSPYSFRTPTSEEIQLMREGLVPPGVHTMRIEVDNSAELWRDWGMGSFGVGAATVLAVVALTGAISPSEDGGTGITLPLTLLFAALAGTEFMLIGLGLGVGMEGGETDMRYRAYADD